MESGFAYLWEVCEFSSSMDSSEKWVGSSEYFGVVRSSSEYGWIMVYRPSHCTNWNELTYIPATVRVGMK